MKLAVLFVTFALVACTGSGMTGPAAAPGASGLPEAALTADFLLLGEVHDNVEQHYLRLRWLEQLAEVHPFALALEQFDADRQPALELARAAEASAPDDLAMRARRIAQAAGFDFDGWDWDLYRPAIELALRRDLPLVAANLSSADTARVAQRRAPAAPPPPGWREAETEAMRASIRAGHCALLPEPAVDAMALAQRTRDARIARALVDAQARTGLPVVLLAGNGHLRRDIGVPLHLAGLRPHAQVVSIGLLETGDTDSGDTATPDDEAAAPVHVNSGAGANFDFAVRTAPQPREDPCTALRERFRRHADDPPA